MITINSDFGHLSKPLASGVGRTFGVVGSASTFFSDWAAQFPAEDGLAYTYSSVTSALADCQTSHGDLVYLSPDFTTALTAAELLAAETKGVLIMPAGGMLPNGSFEARRATAALPATATGHIFTVTGRVRLIEIIGTVTTVIQTQACNLKITLTPSAAGLNATDICSNLNVSANAVNSYYTIDGTLADALINNTGGAAVKQATELTLNAGFLDLITSATNTGSVKWYVRYIPLDPGARMIAA